MYNSCIFVVVIIIKSNKTKNLVIPKKCQKLQQRFVFIKGGGWRRLREVTFACLTDWLSIWLHSLFVKQQQKIMFVVLFVVAVCSKVLEYKFFWLYSSKCLCVHTSTITTTKNIYVLLVVGAEYTNITTTRIKKYYWNAAAVRIKTDGLATVVFFLFFLFLLYCGCGRSWIEKKRNTINTTKKKKAKKIQKEESIKKKIKIK